MMRVALVAVLVLAGLAGCAEPPAFTPETLPADVRAAATPNGGDRAWDPEPCDRIGATTVDGAVEPLPFQEMTSSLQAHFLAQYRDDPLTGEVREEERWTGCMGPGCPDGTVTVRPTERGEVTDAHASTFHAEPVEAREWDEHDVRRELKHLAESLHLDPGDLETSVRPARGWSGLVAKTATGPVNVIGTGIVVTHGPPGGEQTNPDWPQQRITMVRGAFDVPDKTYLAEPYAVSIARADVTCLTSHPADDRPALRVRSDAEPSGSLRILDGSMVWRVRVPLTTGHEADCRSEPAKDEWRWVAETWVDAQTGALHDVAFDSWNPCIIY